jgi:hypothetical protein
MGAMVAGHEIVRPQSHARADRFGFLAQAAMHTAGYLASPDEVDNALLKHPDAQHPSVHLRSGFSRQHALFLSSLSGRNGVALSQSLEYTVDKVPLLQAPAPNSSIGGK